jgi:hypothetical protein
LNEISAKALVNSNKYRRENVMTVSIRAANTIAARRFAEAAFVAALLATPGAALGAGPAMPDGCQQDLNRCSQKVWAHNSLHRGSQQSVQFSNGMTLTCIANGTDTPRTCSLK